GLGTPSGSGGGNKKLFLIVGGAVGALVLAILLLVVLLKVIGGGSPAAVAEDYFGAFAEDDYTQQCELLSKDRRDSLLEEADVDDCDQYAASADDRNKELNSYYEDQYGESYQDIRDDTEYEFEVKDVEEDGDEAFVDYEVTTTYDGDNQDYLDTVLDGDEEQAEDGTMRLVEEDGDWKVAQESYDEDEIGEGE
ncbi:hypothetical protein, partial [Nocardioides sp.]